MMVDQFFQAYLVAYMVVFTMTAGGLCVLLLHLLVGGEWGRVSRKPLRAMSHLWPWMALLFIPIVIGAHSIYPWLRPEVAADLGRKATWLTLPFFTARAVFYFVFFYLVARRCRQLLDYKVPNTPPEYYQKPAGLGMIFFSIICSIASFDWMMSLEPHWASTIYGVLIVMGANLTCMAILIITLAWMQNPARPVEVSVKASHDLGNLMFAFIIFWTYVEVSQYIIIWSGNLPEEIPWYLVRNSHGWKIVSWILVLTQFVIPFLLLLAQSRKKNLNRLAKVALYVLAIRVLDIFWLIAPDFMNGHFHLPLWYPVEIAVLVGFWFFLYRRQLNKEWLA